MVHYTAAIWEKSNYKYHQCWRMVNRRNFVPKHLVKNWSKNSPILIGEDQTTSQPTLITQMLQMMFEHYNSNELNKRHKSNIRVLDIGSGSGIVTALIACIIGDNKNNEVIGMDIFKSLVKQSEDNVKKIHTDILQNFAPIKFIQLDVYDLFKHPNKLGKFDMIYVGAEAKSPTEIKEFQEGIPKLLKKSGVAIAPINNRIQIWCSNGCWVPTNIVTRFVPLERKFTLKHKKHIKHLMGGTRSSSEKKQKKLIKKERDSRISFSCEDDDKQCDIIAITGRSAKLYKNHLFPEFGSMEQLEKWSKDKCIIDIGSGINTLYKKSFISRLTRKKIGKDVVGLDIKKTNNRQKNTRKNKQYARFVLGDAKKIPLKQLKLNPKCDKKIVLINNLLYLWIDDPKELIKFYKNIFSWLNPGSQIRVFPVYFGRYDMYNKDLKKLLETKCDIHLYNPKITAEGLYEWHNKYEKKIYIKKPELKDEKKINKKLEAKTLVLTIK